MVTVLRCGKIVASNLIFNLSIYNISWSDRSPGTDPCVYSGMVSGILDLLLCSVSLAFYQDVSLKYTVAASFHIVWVLISK